MVQINISLVYGYHLLQFINKDNDLLEMHKNMFCKIIKIIYISLNYSKIQNVFKMYYINI